MKKIMAGLLALTMLVGLSGCGKEKTEKSSAGEKINITFSFWEPGVAKELETSLKKIKGTYEEKHPNVNIELISQPVDGYQEWIKAQIVADNLPDIESNYGTELEKQFKAGYVTDITEAFNSPNKYNNNQIWKDTFAAGRLEQAHSYKYAPSFSVPFFGTGLAMFYNKTMYKELGLSVPKTWNEFLANCDVIQKAQKVPVAFMAQKKDAVSWLDWELEVGLFSKKFLSDPNLNYNGDCTIVENEIEKAIENGYLDYTKNTEYQEMYKIFIKTMQDYLKYCPDASGLDEAAAKTMFLSGNVAHIHTGSWDIQSLLKNKDIKFEAGTFEFPSFTDENSPYVGKGLSVASVQTVAVTSNVNKQEGKKEAVIDFLNYLTSPEVHLQFVNETMQIPVMKDVKADSIFDGFMKEGYPPLALFTAGSDKEGKSMKSIFEMLISGEKIEINDLLFADIQKSNKRMSKDDCAKNNRNAENDYDIGKISIVGGKFSEQSN